MENYQIKIELLTETLFGNGEAIPGYVDVDIQTDEYGFPFLKAKTLKGLIRENAELLCKNLHLDMEIAKELFGDEETAGILRFSDASLSPEVQKVLKNYLNDISQNENVTIEKEDVKRAITTEYSFTRIENGVQADHSLRTVRMLNKGMIFWADITASEALSDTSRCLLGCAAGLLKHVGTLKSKGKGCVRAELFVSGKQITSSCFENLGRTEDVR